MIYYLSYIRDITESNYLGIKIDKSIIEPFLKELKEHLGEEDFEKYTNLQQQRDRDTYHITVVGLMDFNKLTKDLGIDKFTNSLQMILRFPIDDLKMMGLGTARKNENKAYFVVCQSEKLKQIRETYGLPEQDFHITLGFLHKDVFGVRKNEIMKKKSELIKLLREEYLKSENFNFLKKIENWEEDPELDIVPISLNETNFKVKVGEKILGVGLIEEKLRVVFRYKEEDKEVRIPTTELIKILKND